MESSALPRQEAPRPLISALTNPGVADRILGMLALPDVARFSWASKDCQAIAQGYLQRQANVLRLQGYTFDRDPTVAQPPTHPASLLKRVSWGREARNSWHQGRFLCFDRNNPITALNTPQIADLILGGLHPREVFEFALLSKTCKEIAYSFWGRQGAAMWPRDFPPMSKPQGKEENDHWLDQGRNYYSKMHKNFAAAARLIKNGKATAEDVTRWAGQGLLEVRHRLPTEKARSRSNSRGSQSKGTMSRRANA